MSTQPRLCLRHLLANIQRRIVAATTSGDDVSPIIIERLPRTLPTNISELRTVEPDICEPPAESIRIDSYREVVLPDECQLRDFLILGTLCY